MEFRDFECLKSAAQSSNYANAPKDPSPSPRATAQDAIQARIREYREAIAQLESLSHALPVELPYVADQCLRDLVLGY